MQVDYRHYGLSAPPRGYQYVRVNNDVVLTAVATGVVASVIYQLFQ
jgi:Ni/Co efflux regulator RcnB